MEFIEIQRGSAAWHAIGDAILTGHTLRLAEFTGDTVKVKINEGMWTPPISTVTPFTTEEIERFN